MRRMAAQPYTWVPVFAGATVVVVTVPVIARDDVYVMSRRSPIGVGDDGELASGMMGLSGAR